MNKIKEKVLKELKPAPLNFKIKLYDVVQVEKGIDLTLTEVGKVIDDKIMEIKVAKAEFRKMGLRDDTFKILFNEFKELKQKLGIK